MRKSEMALLEAHAASLPHAELKSTVILWKDLSEACDSEIRAQTYKEVASIYAIELAKSYLANLVETPAGE